MNSVYCHCCWLFADRYSPNFRNDWINGVYDWVHLSQQIKCHKELSIHHNAVSAESMYSEKKSRIDKEMEQHIAKKANFWYQVLERLVDIIFTLVAGNLPLRGHREKLGELGSGNFLSIVELVAKYNSELKELIEKPTSQFVI